MREAIRRPPQGAACETFAHDAATHQMAILNSQVQPRNHQSRTLPFSIRKVPITWQIFFTPGMFQNHFETSLIKIHAASCWMFYYLQVLGRYYIPPLPPHGLAQTARPRSAEHHFRSKSYVFGHHFTSHFFFKLSYFFDLILNAFWTPQHAAKPCFYISKSLFAPHEKVIILTSFWPPKSRPGASKMLTFWRSYCIQKSN